MDKITPIQALKNKFMEAGALSDWMDDAFDEALIHEKEFAKEVWEGGRDYEYSKIANTPARDFTQFIEQYNKK